MDLEGECVANDKYRMPPSPDASNSTDVPFKHKRPRFFDYRTRRYQWRFAHIPQFIKSKGETIQNPFLERAIFVVHGIGKQSLSETAAKIRDGFEDAVQDVEPENWGNQDPNTWIVPQPYIYDGFWADYHDFEKFVPEAWDDFSERQQQFFSRVWNRRIFSLGRCREWLFDDGVNLWWKARWFPDKVYYTYLVPTLLIVAGLVAHWPKTQKSFRDYLSDARVYLRPTGDLEHEIIQRIEYRIGCEFLRLLGLDRELELLDEDDQIWVAGRNHIFKEVVWVSHSLGSLISYNVFGDILHKCLECRNNNSKEQDVRDEQAERIEQAVLDERAKRIEQAKLIERAEQIKRVERVENGIRAFVTLGSPLDKIRYLYEGGVLRDWPNEYLPGGMYDLWENHKAQGGLWYNFYYNDDPVSGALSRFTSPHKNNANVVNNNHTRDGFLQVPGMSHNRYWNDPEVLKRILGLHYEPFVKLKFDKLKPEWRQKIGLLAGAIFWGVLLTGVIVLVLLLARAGFLEILEKLHLVSAS